MSTWLHPSVTRKMAKALALTWNERLFLLRAAVMLLVVELAVKLVSVPRLMRILAGRPSPARSEPARAIAPVDRLCYLTEVVSRHWPRKPTCLKMALVLHALLHRRGLDARLMIGAARGVAGIEAHAWIEYEGKVILGGPVERYQTLLGADGRSVEVQIA